MWEGVNTKIAQIVASRPVLCVSVSLLICIIFSSGLARVQVETDIRRSFSPENSDSAEEARRYLEFFNLTVYPSRSFILFQTKDGGDILTEEALSEIGAMDRHIMNHLLIKDPVDDLEACHPLCNANLPFHLFLEELRAQRAGNTSTARRFDYPRSMLRGVEIFVGLNIYGINRTVQKVMKCSHGLSGADTVTSDKNAYNSSWELTLGLFEQSKHENESSPLTFYIFGEEIANHEMVEGAFEAIVLMTIGFVFLFVFVTLVILRSTPKRMTPQLVASTVITPIVATIAAFGVQAWMGYAVYSIQCVTPFLVLGIGVDDAFILVHWWHHYRHITDRDERMKKVLVDVGPSITITSLTNIIAFGVGFLTPTPQMSLFCLCTSIALLFDYLITYSVLAPIVYLCANIEKKEYLAVKPAPTSMAPSKSSRFIRIYSRFLCSLCGRVLSALMLISLYAFCAIGVFTVQTTFNPSKAFPANSILVKAVDKIGPVFNEFFPLQIFVNNPPKVSDPEQYRSFYEMVDTLENLPLVHSDNKTILFLRQYEEYDRTVTDLARLFLFAPSDEYQLSLHNLGPFLDMIHRPPTIKFNRPENVSHEGELDAFQMTIFARKMSEWSHRALFEQEIRDILGKYPQFNASIFDADSSVLAVILTTRDDLIGSICLTVACMACVCLFFIQNRIGVVIITFTISSICFCLIGLLSWWGVDLDPVMQVDVLLATGFSVDYTAHIAYQYYQATGSAEDRLFRSLTEMAMPMLQAGISTFLCMLPLIFIQTYTIVCFAKTVFIVVGCGLYHGLIVLPVLLSFTPFGVKKELEPVKGDVTDIDRAEGQLMLVDRQNGL